MRKHRNTLTLHEKTINKQRTKRNFIIGSSEKPYKQITKNHKLILSFTRVHMCIITLSVNIFWNKRQRCLHFFYQINYKSVYWNIYIISAHFFFMWIITYINKGLNLFSFFLKNFYVQHRNSKITKYVSKDTFWNGNDQFSGVF